MGMVDVSSKDIVIRTAEARGFIQLQKKTLSTLRAGTIKKGDPLVFAEAAGMLAVKRTPDLIPHCHPIPVEQVDFRFAVDDDGVDVSCTVKSRGRTGVEMEALLGVTMALNTIWDMVKYLEKDEEGQYPLTRITDVRVVGKTKGALT